jgi:biopolymer transport protein ExbD
MRISTSLVQSSAFEKHLVNRRRKRSWALKAAGFTLMLTSMVDMFSMLVVFLLQTFSSSPEILITKGVELPNSLTPSIVKEAPVLSLSKDGNLYLDQKLVGATTVVSKRPQLLLKKLSDIKQGWANNHAGPFPGEINLQADREVPSTTVSEIMGVLTSSEYESIQLAVIGR